MRNTICYEWDYETTDDNGDILEHNHSDKLSQFSQFDETDSLVLVRDSGNEANGLEDRTWAYVINGKLPEYFSDAFGNPVYKIPNRFHLELSRYLVNVL